MECFHLFDKVKMTPVLFYNFFINSEIRAVESIFRIQIDRDQKTILLDMRILHLQSQQALYIPTFFQTLFLHPRATSLRNLKNYKAF